VVVLNHISPQNLISDPYLTEKEQYGKKYFLVAIRPAKKCESPDFQVTWDIAFDPTYFLHNMFCHTPSWINNLANHFPSKALFLTYRS
jgi:hypothetical protein